MVFSLTHSLDAKVDLKAVKRQNPDMQGYKFSLGSKRFFFYTKIKRETIRQEMRFAVSAQPQRALDSLTSTINDD